MYASDLDILPSVVADGRGAISKSFCVSMSGTTTAIRIEKVLKYQVERGSFVLQDPEAIPDLKLAVR